MRNRMVGAARSVRTLSPSWLPLLSLARGQPLAQNAGVDRRKINRQSKHLIFARCAIASRVRDSNYKLAIFVMAEELSALLARTWITPIVPRAQADPHSSCPERSGTHPGSRARLPGTDD